VAEAESREHLEKIEELEQSLFELRGEIGGGRHVPPGVRVLSLRDNPEQQWVDLRQAAMDRLKGENEALMRRLKELEESGVMGGGDGKGGEELVPRESWELVNKERSELEDVVKQKEKRLLRLQQVRVVRVLLVLFSRSAILDERCSHPKAPNSGKQLRLSLDSNWHFIPMVKCASRRCMTSAHHLYFSLPQRRRGRECSWLRRGKVDLRISRS